jgi:hypothetical protein
MDVEQELETMRQIDEMLNALDPEPHQCAVAWIVQKHRGGDAAQGQKTRKHSVRRVKSAASSPPENIMKRASEKS